MKIFSTNQLYKADKITIKKQKIRSTDLMERAGNECFNWLHQKIQGAPFPIHVFCGIGNNGGDGLVIGRLLMLHGYNVKIYIANFTDKRSKDFLINYNLIKDTSNEWPFLMTSEEDFPIIEEDDKFFKAKHYGSDSETVYIDRYTGVIKILTISKINGNKKISLFEHLKCERVEKKF